MELKQQAISELEFSGNAVQDYLSSFDEERLNKKPGSEVWSVGQITEHLSKSTRSISKILSIDGFSTDRKPDSLVLQLKEIMEDMVHKTKSAEFLLPAELVRKAELTSEFSASLEELVRMSEQADLSIIPYNVTFPTIGPITKLEWLFFAGFHIKRHWRQIRNLHQL